MRSKNRFPAVIKAAAILTGLITAGLTAAYHFFPLDWLFSAAITFGTTCYHFAMRLLVGAVVPPLLRRVRPDQRWFRQRPREPRLYRNLKVHRWKGKLPTYDPNQFSLKEHTLQQVVHNMCVAEAVHEVIIVFSFLPLLFAIPFGAFPVFLITSLTAALYDGVFVVAQRYNRPRLCRILHKKEALAHE